MEVSISLYLVFYVWGALLPIVCASVCIEIIDLVEESII
jgi:hypothetical protein